jgi:membrane carboxypeptidase/penicillin-binding protein PbpC
MLTDILKDNLARSPAFGRASQLVIPNHPEVAVKTGTSNELRDNLTVGYNQNFLVAVWVGNNDNSPMSRIASGLTGASSIFHKIMTGLLSDTDSITWDVPSGIKQTAVCTFTGTLPCGSCPTKNELFLEENSPSRACRQDQILVLEDERGNFNWGYSVDAF